MTVEKIKHNSHIVITDIVNGQLIKKVYIGYTIKESKKLFRELTDRLKKEHA